MYDWQFNSKAEKQFSKLDKPIQKRILAWLNNNITGTNNPRIFGKSLEGELSTLWRYRVGKYRIIASIEDKMFTVTVVKVGKRNDIYNQGK
ncbi:type II toxin-antitoxin system RelE/ParE family toxin [Listeria monocytogenes]|uniref:type II toxin-antitoxin system RelE family toxin n=1 Tax=Listeria monocytogenes TaxID=1639 RepID=UPI000F17BEF7|nr:type II toxin-antitoxin system RelE/ParE family toxin [Listeria monocytogenes]EAD0738602.1 type II toxin-antitoxin system RelE/ParE family toxin [Listeria monocytogenes]MCN73778.1 type II toxin-antitoxin system RelE/ParE family toxin [Listeria monocytogenes]TYU88938.1 type II toxin-antitoxin system RelE/ParE family toxin [Listeria monocytogenes]